MAKLLQASYIERTCNSRDRPALRNSICATDWKRLGGTLPMPLPADRGKASACQNGLLPAYVRSSFSRSSTS